MFVTENKQENKQEKAPKWMIVLRNLLIALCMILIFALVTVYADQINAWYSYQSFYSEFKQVFTTCENNTVYWNVKVGTVDNTQTIQEKRKERERLEDLLSKVQTEEDALILWHWEPIYENKAIWSTTECTDRIIGCGDWKITWKEQCENSLNCSNLTCTCNPWFILMNYNTCQAIPMSEEKEPELMRTGASIKKKFKK